MGRGPSVRVGLKCFGWSPALVTCLEWQTPPHPPPNLSEVEFIGNLHKSAKMDLHYRWFMWLGSGGGGVRHTNEFIGKYQLTVGLVLHHH